MGEKITPRLITTIALGRCPAHVLLWAYFGVDDERGGLALAAIPDRERFPPAVLAYRYSMYPRLIGIVVARPGIQMSVTHRNVAASVATAALSGGVALYFFGQFLFSSTLWLPRSRPACSRAAVAATISIGITSCAGPKWPRSSRWATSR
ncbi:low temperature requirement protein A [Nocardia sp. NPDC023852]|uniref:low temperature requirement protein A n=1 Tax=Nocardia sp. NPDC023852 TaxID=3154697 RepID=UPI00340B4828